MALEELSLSDFGIKPAKAARGSLKATILKSLSQGVGSPNAGVQRLSFLLGPHATMLTQSVKRLRTWLVGVTSKNFSEEEVFSELWIHMLHLAERYDESKLSVEYAGKYLLKYATKQVRRGLTGYGTLAERANMTAKDIDDPGLQLSALTIERALDLEEFMKKFKVDDPHGHWFLSGLLEGFSLTELTRAHCARFHIKFYPSQGTKLLQRFIARNCASLSAALGVDAKRLKEMLSRDTNN